MIITNQHKLKQYRAAFVDEFKVVRMYALRNAKPKGLECLFCDYGRILSLLFDN